MAYYKAFVSDRFANSLPINDPLQTLYQLMSGRMPASATVRMGSLFMPVSNVVYNTISVCACMRLLRVVCGANIQILSLM